MSLLTVCAVVLISVLSVQGWPGGAPSNICFEGYVPNHGNTVGITNNNYKIEIKRLTNNNFGVELSHPTNSLFRGFLIYPVDITETPIGGGEFTNLDTNTKNFSCNGVSLITHTNNSLKQTVLAEYKTTTTEPAGFKAVVVITDHEDYYILSSLNQ
ncbi:uncharacterized protein LOC121880071 [Homarus americanus]|uniref:uncharacterized protein LOC121880071 n=1 Tax=Homarus americanus TaxID=6706 RepID=UPI001C458CC7|nr:uncharacterized protein LOC121880071 [Homarus americanus]XP_042243024.1 uncharacterized protein LOC121880071 [Homarus americanus]